MKTIRISLAFSLSPFLSFSLSPFLFSLFSYFLFFVRFLIGLEMEAEAGLTITLKRDAHPVLVATDVETALPTGGPCEGSADDGADTDGVFAVLGLDGGAAGGLAEVDEDICVLLHVQLELGVVPKQMCEGEERKGEAERIGIAFVSTPRTGGPLLA